MGNTKIPPVSVRQGRPCYETNNSCIFYQTDEDCCNDWCNNEKSKYKDPEDRRERPCELNFTIDEIQELIDQHNAGELNKIPTEELIHELSRREPDDIEITSLYSSDCPCTISIQPRVYQQLRDKFNEQRPKLDELGKIVMQQPVCPVCCGSGDIVNSSGSPTAEQWVECPCCKGSGQQPRQEGQ